jgi:TolA-binding protein
MRRTQTFLLLALVVGCAGNPDRQTLAQLRDAKPDLAEVQIENGLDEAMTAYQHFLAQAPKSALTPEAMRRLADLKLEKEYGILGDGGPAALPVPTAAASAEPVPVALDRMQAVGIADHTESERDFERRIASEQAIAPARGGSDVELPGGDQIEWSGPLEAIELYDQILASYPDYEHNDRVLYQKARAYDELGRNDEAIAVIDRLIAQYPHSRYIDEVQFRRGEYFFTRRKYLDAEESYAAVTALGVSPYYELALYKLGWTLYKQEMHEEALQQYVALLDYKVSTGYDFDQAQDEESERRIADTYRVISLSFSNLGGPEAVQVYFAQHGQRSYEDRIYSHLGEFYFEKLRYQDAASVYQTFVGLYPLHRASPHFSMRVVEIYEKGGFPKLVLESKKAFAASYGLQSEYWRHFEIADSPEVRSYLKNNLKDLANHYHALYQEKELAGEKPANFGEALLWYRAYLESFPAEAETPSLHYRLADLLLEHEDFGHAAREYEHTAYAYPEHEQAAAAGYAAIHAHRGGQKRATGAGRTAAQQEAVTSTLRFVERFPAHAHAAAVLGVALDDLYEMKQYESAIANGHRLIEAYPTVDLAIRRSAWAVIAHSSFDLARYEQAEQAYARVLEMTTESDDSRQGFVDNLAAAIYKQGEQASAADDPRAAADHFLRITQAAPSSAIRPVAEYDAGAALIRLEDWAAAASVLDSFRKAYPEHELNEEATKQMAFVYRQEGDLSRAAEEYERVAAEAEDTELQREALLVSGELYEESKLSDRALSVYRRYIERFPRPLEIAVETRFKVARIHAAKSDTASYHAELRKIVEIDGKAGAERSERVRFLGAQSALVLSEVFYHRFDEVALVQPFEKNLQEKQRRMDAALAAFNRLVDYEVGEVTAAATFYMAEVYLAFSKALIESERPKDFGAAELQDYELVLEEEAFPFEERSITVHEKNLELMTAGVYNRWIEKSLEQLAVLMPGRYAKFEESSGWIGSIDRYAYRAPSLPAPQAVPAPAEPAASETEPESEAAPASDAPAPEPVHEEQTDEVVVTG